ncbi:polyribonucleotide nucleotidyltransferase [Citromicrobium phage vB_CbaS-RXM]|nr:polyribonucleotide nucleotidyltransferase [Citromicrobium phage vB_CbaS-RXM]
MGSLVPAGRTGAISVYEGSDNPWADQGREVESGAFLNFNGNSGELTFGADDNVLPDGSTVVADFLNQSVGWICWKDSEPVEEVLIPVTEGKPPMEHELKDHGPYDDEDDGWREATAIPMVIESVGGDPEHEFVGTKLLFKTSTRGAVRSVKKVAGQFGKQFREHMGELPVIEVTTEGYTPREKKYGKKYAINFKIVDWFGEDQLAELAGLLPDEDGEYLPEDADGADDGAAAAAAEAAAAKKAEEEAAAKAAAEAEAKRLADEEAAAAAAAEAEPAPPPRRTRRTAAAPAADAPAAEDAAPAAAPARRRTAAPAAAANDAEMEPAPEPVGRSAERGGRRTRRFAQ